MTVRNEQFHLPGSRRNERRGRTTDSRAGERPTLSSSTHDRALVVNACLRGSSREAFGTRGPSDSSVVRQYALICSVQLDVTPEQYLDSLAGHPGEAPEIPGGGSPHYSKGMITEFTVE